MDEPRLPAFLREGWPLKKKRETPNLLSLMAYGLLAFMGLWWAVVFSIIAWRGYIVWEHRPLAIIEAIVALFVAFLGVERFLHAGDRDNHHQD